MGAGCGHSPSTPQTRKHQRKAPLSSSLNQRFSIGGSWTPLLVEGLSPDIRASLGMNGGIRRPETLSVLCHPARTPPRGRRPPPEAVSVPSWATRFPARASRASRGSLAPGTLRGTGENPQDGLRQGQPACRLPPPRLSEAGLSPGGGSTLSGGPEAGAAGLRSPHEGGRKPRATGAPPKPSTPKPSKSCPRRYCGIHGPHHQLSPPAPVRSRSPPTPLPTPGLGSGFRGTGCAPKDSRDRRWREATRGPATAPTRQSPPSAPGSSYSPRMKVGV